MRGVCTRPWAAGSLRLLLSASLAACVPAPKPWPGATPDTWPALRAKLAEERARWPVRPWSAEVDTVLHEPRSGRTVRGRGGIAVHPARGVRLILLGVAGFTMLDAWVTPGAWRVAVPPLGIVRRGGKDEPSDLPIAFLRGWFFRPLAGTLFAAAFEPGGPTWLLRDGRAVVELRARACDRGTRLIASRREDGRTQSVDECRAGGPPRAGDHVHYEDGATGLAVDLTLAAVGDRPPATQAFDDPDIPTLDAGEDPL